MSARAEHGPLSWEETEQNLHGGQVPGRGEIESRDFLSVRGEADMGVPLHRTPVSQGQWNAVQKRRDRLRNEIKRGKEYLEQIQRELADHRARVEEWPAYENHCGKNPLQNALQLISVNERIAQFLPGWIRRREEKLAAAIREIDLLAKQTQVGFPKAEIASLAGSLVSV